MRRKTRGVLAISKSVTALLDNSPIPPFMEVIAGLLHQKNQNGKVIFANDPHIGFSQPEHGMKPI
jgi:penicillin amidase